MINFKKIILKPEEKLINSMKILQKYQCKLVLVCDLNLRLVGIISDGDIRRHLLDGGSLDDQVSKAMNSKPFTLNFKKNKKDNLAILKDNGIICAPILNKNKQVVDFLFLDEIYDKKISNSVIIMAGGKGRRLLPLTKKIPKPLIKMGEQTILEMMINNLKKFGFNNFYISVNYLKNKIMDYLGDGSKLDVKIEYINEKTYLGTAGSLSLLSPKPKKSVLVLNGDIITNLDFKKFLNFHLKHKGIATMAVREFITNLPYGVIEEKNGLIKNITEKPTITNFINAGMYILSPKFFDFLEYNKKIDMPDVFRKAIIQKKKTHLYSFYNSWFEVGRLEDLERAKKIFDE